MAPTRLGIIGAGIMGERMLRAALDHAPALVAVTGLWDIAAGALERLGPLVAGSASVEAVIAAADCVYIATPPATHLAYAGQALAAGRAVFLEKPLATDVPAAVAFVDRHGSSRVAVNFPFASSFAVERLRAWLGPAPAGPLDIHVGFRTWPRPWQHAAAAWLDAPAEGGFTREVVSHFLFLARRLLGPLTLHTATVECSPGGTERAIHATLQAGATPVTLTGSVGRIEADDHNTWTMDGVRLRDWSWAEREGPPGHWTPDAAAAPNERMRPLVLRRQLEGVVAMTRSAPHDLATLAEALDVQTVVEGILAKRGAGPL